MTLIAGAGILLAAFLIAIMSIAYWVDAVHKEVNRLADRMNRAERAITTGRHIHWEDEVGD